MQAKRRPGQRSGNQLKRYAALITGDPLRLFYLIAARTKRSTKRLLGSSVWKMPVLSNAAVAITRAKQPLRKWRRSENPCETTYLDPAACNFPGFVLHLYYFTRKALCAKRSSNEILMIWFKLTQDLRPGSGLLCLCLNRIIAFSASSFAACRNRVCL